MAHKPYGKLRKVPEYWPSIRARIYDRDDGYCYACNRRLGYNFFICGHVVDRAVGGTDEDDNLVVLCIKCERSKPVHHTFEEFRLWVQYDRTGKQRPPQYKQGGKKHGKKDHQRHLR